MLGCDRILLLIIITRMITQTESMAGQEMNVNSLDTMSMAKNSTSGLIPVIGYHIQRILFLIIIMEGIITKQLTVAMKMAHGLARRTLNQKKI